VVDLDASNLTKHTVAELRQFCREKKLAVRGRRKGEFVAAISAYLAKGGEGSDGLQEGKKNGGTHEMGDNSAVEKERAKRPPSPSNAAQPGVSRKRIKRTGILQAGSEVIVGGPNLERLDKMSRLEYQEQKAQEV
jgi:hypothetical protein